MVNSAKAKAITREKMQHLHINFGKQLKRATLRLV